MRAATLALFLLSLAGCPGSSSGLDARLLDHPGAWPERLVAVDALSDRATADAPGPGGERRPDAGLPPLLPQGVTLFINLGDSIAAGYYASSGHSYRALLVKNDDALYPAYAGKDLQSRFPGIKLSDLSKSGSTTSGLVQQAQNAPGNPSGNTLVVISSGGNDFNDDLLAMVDPVKSAAVAQTALANLGKVAARFANKTAYPGQVTVVMLNVHDPTDGTGNVPLMAGLTGFCTTIQKIGLLVGPIAVANLVSFDQTLAGAAASPGWALVDNHQAFLGHGFHYNDPASPHYQAADPTLWFHIDCVHGNDRGHHELRRLIWRRLFGD
jgi:lysophospholipase L1-like esterase